MDARNSIDSRTLYERDYAIWLETTIEQLKRGQFSRLDLENLVEELEGMVRSDRRALESYLTRLFEHFLKLAYWKSEREYNRRGWTGKITNFRIQIARLLEDSPSLKPYLEKVFQRSYRDARKIFLKTTGLDPREIPAEPIATLEEVLDEDWFPDV
ncbi:DUF29 domain-containing protein [Pannus brasiliensis CCIBt3594]|uniref:DUF29 domain-containing protein n=1 Tax=Pannus brasiliensis CCIBt3594 TaxID=1427578 RepID=A0AAW9QNP3_9CHRO